ncbi:MAG: TetR/AcrR family transcriptional regulator [Acidimicrobiales bacterium]|jgi:AcrR family transcriptional regulator
MTVRSDATASGVDEVEELPADGEPARPMRADARRNYERLVAAARTVFAQQGGGASMDAIAKEAGVGVGTLYRHFPKRIDVVEAVYREDVDQLVDAAERYASEWEPWPALVAWLEAFVNYAIGKRRFLSELHEAFEKNPELKSSARERIEGALTVVLARAQEAGLVRADLDGPDLMQLLGSMCMSATLTPEQSTRLLAVILDGLHPPA